MNEHQKKLVWSQLKVGLVITAALGVMFATIFFWGRITSVFVPKATIVARMPAVQGLRNNAPVWLLGVEIGVVQNIELKEDGVWVVLSVRENKLRLIHSDATASILTIGLLGDKYVAIEPGSTEEPTIEPGAVIDGENPPGMAEIVETSARSIQKVDEFLNLFESVVSDIEEGRGTIGRLLGDTLLYDQLREITVNLAQISRTIRYGEGTAGKLLRDPSMYNDLAQAGKELSRFGAQLNDTSGTINKLVSNDEIYRNLLQTTRELDSIMTRIESGEGLAGSLISDKELARQLQRTMQRIDALLEDIMQDPKQYFNFELF